MAPSSLAISDGELRRLQACLEKAGLRRVAPKNPYELMRIDDGRVSMIVYTSGKVVHNGSRESKELLRASLTREAGYEYFLGSDEAGKGEWYGPLVVAATALTPDEVLALRILGVRDSKTIPGGRLVRLAERILEMRFPRSTVTLTPERYNELYREFQGEGKSLNDMLAWAHARALKDLLAAVRPERAKAVIDRFDAEKTELRLEGIDRRKVEVLQKTKGESEIPVAAAGIIAKYVFEKEVDALDERFGISLRRCRPGDLQGSILPKVAKLHFRNVQAIVE